MMLEAVEEFDFVKGEVEGEEEGKGKGEETNSASAPTTTTTTTTNSTINPHTLEAALPDLNMYFVGGEMLSRDLALSFFRSSSPSARLFNM